MCHISLSFDIVDIVARYLFKCHYDLFDFRNSVEILQITFVCRTWICFMILSKHFHASPLVSVNIWSLLWFIAVMTRISDILRCLTIKAATVIHFPPSVQQLIKSFCLISLLGCSAPCQLADRWTRLTWEDLLHPQSFALALLHHKRNTRLGDWGQWGNNLDSQSQRSTSGGICLQAQLAVLWETTEERSEMLIIQNGWRSSSVSVQVKGGIQRKSGYISHCCLFLYCLFILSISCIKSWARVCLKQFTAQCDMSGLRLSTAVAAAVKTTADLHSRSRSVSGANLN